jgi:DEAD/DEAH box helicase domain-containing protein
MVSRYDGATPQEDRSTIRAGVQVLLTNPDMLHRGILPWHEKNWPRFFRQLRFVIIDECHEYRGIFGTNVAYACADCVRCP